MAEEKRNQQRYIKRESKKHRKADACNKKYRLSEPFVF